MTVAAGPASAGALPGLLAALSLIGLGFGLLLLGFGLGLSLNLGLSVRSKRLLFTLLLCFGLGFGIGVILGHGQSTQRFILGVVLPALGADGERALRLLSRWL